MSMRFWQGGEIGRIRQALRQITGISTPFGGISWNLSGSKTNEIPIFDKEIHVTSYGNEAFISFLDNNEGRIVFVRSALDASVTTSEQFEMASEEGLDIDSICAGKFSGTPLPLPNEGQRLISVAFHFSDRHVLQYSAGGTGMVMVEVVGFFEVSRTLHGGPTTVFHLKEIDAPLKLRNDFLNRQRATAQKIASRDTQS